MADQDCLLGQYQLDLDLEDYLLEETLQAANDGMDVTKGVSPVRTIKQPQLATSTSIPGLDLTQNISTKDATDRALALYKECEALKAHIRQIYAEQNARAEAFENFLQKAAVFNQTSSNLFLNNAFQDLEESATNYKQIPTTLGDVSAELLRKINQLKQEMQAAITMLQKTKSFLHQGLQSENDVNTVSPATLTASKKKIEQAILNLRSNASNFNEVLVSYVNGRKVAESRKVKSQIADQIEPWWADPDGAKVFVQNLQKLFLSTIRIPEEEIKRVGGDLQGPVRDMIEGVVGLLNAFIAFLIRMEQTA